MFFKRKKAEQAAEPAAGQSEQPQELGTGPYDISQIENPEDYLDFGSILLKPVDGLQLRLDVEESKQRIIGISFAIADSRVQLMAFSASKSDTLWPGIAQKIKSDIEAQNGTIVEREHEKGSDLMAQVPQQLPDGTPGYVALRFAGFDGPRWFLRATIGGAALTDEAAAAQVEEVLYNVVVNRGDKPLPPAELLPLTQPSNAQARPLRPEDDRPAASRPERGPEITQIG